MVSAAVAVWTGDGKRKKRTHRKKSRTLPNPSKRNKTGPIMLSSPRERKHLDDYPAIEEKPEQQKRPLGGASTDCSSTRRRLSSNGNRSDR
eukprot:5327856-Pyramimonas_sp.AAC.1